MNKQGQSGTFHSFCTLNFSSLSEMVIIGLPYVAFILLGKIAFVVLVSLEIFYHKRILDFVKDLLMKMILWFLLICY